MVHEYASARHNISPPLIIDTDEQSSVALLEVVTSDESQSSRPRQSPSTSSSRPSRLEKTEKIMRTAAKVFIKYMAHVHNIVDSSEEDD